MRPAGDERMSRGATRRAHDDRMSRTAMPRGAGDRVSRAAVLRGGDEPSLRAMLRDGNDAVTRRAVLRGAASAVAFASLAPSMRRAFAADGLETTPVAPGLTLVRGAGGNILVLATDEGQVVVDSGAAESGPAVLAALAGLPGERVTALFNTHWHLDQVGSNAALGEAGAAVFAHAKTRQRLSAGYYVPSEERYEPPLPPAGVPTEIFYTNGSTSIGGRRIEYGYLIEAHTDGDIYVSFPDLDVIAVGGVVSPVRDPALDWFGGGWLGGRVDSLALLLDSSSEDTRFVPSYGPVVGRAEVEAEHDMLLELFDRMVEHVRLGETADDMLAAGVLDGLGRRFDDPRALLYDAHKGFWAHHNKLMPDIV